MIRSMTGFGEASAKVDGAQYSVEIRSVNNRYLKTQVRIPDELQGLEAEIDAAVARRLSRGSIIVTVRCFDVSSTAAATINTAAVQHYLKQLLSIDGLQKSGNIDIAALLSLPGVIVPADSQQRVETSKPILLRLVSEACDKLEAMRTREGQTLLADLHKHCGAIAEQLLVVKTRVPATVQMYQERLRQRMQSLLAEFGTTVREEDLMREVAVYAERSDVAEEVARLEGHLAQLAEIINAADGEPSGRTLDFLSQELLREANTIASKCLDVEISRKIVEIKSAIDRIKEQAQNVE